MLGTSFPRTKIGSDISRPGCPPPCRTRRSPPRDPSECDTLQTHLEREPRPSTREGTLLFLRRPCLGPPSIPGHPGPRHRYCISRVPTPPWVADEGHPRRGWKEKERRTQRRRRRKIVRNDGEEGCHNPIRQRKEI